MRRSKLIPLFGALLLAGCEHGNRVNDDPYGSSGVPMVQMLYNETVDNGILAQHTLFPHHFVMNSTKLNELGQRDLGVLSRHFVTAPGELSVRRGTASAQLYEARVAGVRQRMIASGVDPERITITSALPGGSGMSSDFVLSIVEELTAPEKGRRAPQAASTTEPAQGMTTGTQGGNYGSSRSN